MSQEEVIQFSFQLSTLRLFCFLTCVNNILESTSEVENDSELFFLRMSADHVSIYKLHQKYIHQQHQNNLKENLSHCLSSSARLFYGPPAHDMCPWTHIHVLTCFLFFLEMVTFYPYFSHVFSSATREKGRRREIQ